MDPIEDKDRIKELIKEVRPVLNTALIKSASETMRRFEQIYTTHIVQSAMFQLDERYYGVIMSYREEMDENV